MKLIKIYLALILSFVLISCGGNDRNEEHSNEYPERKHSDEKTVLAFTKHQLDHINLQIAEVELKPVEMNLQFSGRAALNERTTAHITSRVKGRVEKVYSVVADKVKKDQTLLEIYSQEFIASQSEFIQAEERLKRLKQNDPDFGTAHSIYESAKTKLEVIGLTNDDIENLAEFHKPYQYLKVLAPFDGTLLSGEIRQGEFVDIGREFFLIANLSTIWVLADVFEKDMLFLKEGMQGEIIVPSYPTDKFFGKVVRIYDIVDPASRTIKVRFEANNQQLKLKPEMFVNVNVKGAFNGTHLKILSSSVLKEGENYYVFTALTDTTFEKKEIKIGIETKEYTEVIKGLKSGDKVASSGTFYLKSELAKSTFVEDEH